MSIDRARHAYACSHRRRKRAFSGIVLTVATALAIAAFPVAANAKVKAGAKLKPKEIEHVNKEPFGNIPKGPLHIIVSIDQQQLHLYSDGAHIADTAIATGVPAHPTPLGVFSIIQKNRFHRSNIYSAAPMPYMERITWSGVALHEGANLGHPASHGCIRMSHDFATRLWALTRLGARVIISGPELRPEEFADPHLFVHKVKAASPVPAASGPASVEPVKTVQTADNGKATDAALASARAPATVDPPATAANANTSARPVTSQTPEPVEPGIGAMPPSTEPSEFKTAVTAPVAGLEAIPVPPGKPVEIVHASKAPIAILVSRKDKRIYVRQDFAPLFDAPITIEHPEQRFGTHVFTAMEYLHDGSSLRWNVVSLPDEKSKAAWKADEERKSTVATRRGERADKPLAKLPLPTASQALARIEIPQDVIDQISQLIVPGSSLIVSDQGLGEETGEGTDFIVMTQ